jgi:hypothetical protein
MTNPAAGYSYKDFSRCRELFSFFEDQGLTGMVRNP